MDSPVVCLNVAGCYFTTARETVLREPASKLALQVRGVLPTLKDEAGHVFIDRDPRFFQAILNYLRDGWTLLPPTASERRELMQEVRFYQMVEGERLEGQLYGMQLNGMESWLRTQELLGEKSDAVPKDGDAPEVDLASPIKRSDSPAPAPTTPGATITPVRARPASPPLYRPIHCPPPSCPPPCCPSPCCPPPRCPSPCCKPSCCDPCCRPVCSPLAALQSLKPCIPPQLDDGFRWTSKYLRTNPKIREVVDTMLELAYMPPNRALTVGKVFVSISNCPEGEAHLSNKYLVVKVCGAYGWTFEFTVRPSCDYSLYQKYNVCEYVQDNWFVLSAILKDQYGLMMEEDYCQRHSSILSRRQNLHICLSKPGACRPVY